MDDDHGVVASVRSAVSRLNRGPWRLAAAGVLSVAAAVAASGFAGSPLAARPPRSSGGPPCRLTAPRGGGGPLTGPPLSAGPARAFDAGGQCGVSTRATAVTAHLTVVRAQGSGYLAFGPAGGPPPAIAAIRFRAGQIR